MADKVSAVASIGIVAAIGSDVAGQNLAEELFRLAVEACPSGMVMTDRSGRIVMVNTEIERLFGYRREELLGRQVDMLLPERLRAQHIKHRKIFAASPEIRQLGVGRVLFGRRKDGSEFPVEVGLNPIHIRESLLTLSVVVDISERQRVERLKEEFVSTVSHELRTPLTSITASLALLNAGGAGILPGPAARLVTIAHNNGQRLVRLINDILDIEKMESGKVVFDFKKVEIRSIVEQAIDANRAYAEGYGVRVRLDSESVSCELKADADRLVQVITNLLSNAVKFSPRGEEVVVAIGRRENIVRITVRDHGSGIPEEFKSHVFEKFAQADATNMRQKSGTGLGLSIVQQIVRRLGGEVGFDSAVDRGTIFHVELPLWDAQAEAQAAAAKETGNQRLLLCDDDADVVEILRDRLVQSGFTVDVAATASEAMERAKTVSYAAVLADLQLPDGDGISLIQQLRAQPQYFNTPIVIVAANPNRGRDDLRSSTLNILDWLEKPVDIGRLVRVLNSPIVRDDSVRPRILHVDDDADVLGLVAQVLARSADVVSVSSVDKARQALAAQQFDLAILDVALAAGTSLDLLPDLRDSDGDPIPVILFSAQGANPACAARTHAALAKSSSTIESLIATLRKRLGTKSSPVANKQEIA